MTTETSHHSELIDAYDLCTLAREALSYQGALFRAVQMMNERGDLTEDIKRLCHVGQYVTDSYVANLDAQAESTKKALCALEQLAETHEEVTA